MLAAGRGSLTAIIYTHSHIDQVGAAAVCREAGTQLWARGALRDRLGKQYGVFQRADMRRGGRQLRRDIAEPICRARRVASASTSRSPRPASACRVTLVSGRTTLEIGGTTMELVEVLGETHDQLFIWLPDRRALLPGDKTYYAFPNL